MFTFYSPLRYPGGKTSLLKYLSKIIHLNNPIKTYIEPFAGGAGAALGLLFNEHVQRIILNDSDEFIYKFWRAVLCYNNRLIERIENASINIEEWKKQRALLENIQLRKKASDLDIGFATLYMNRCNRSGILTAGPIGGYNQLSEWKIDVRFKKDYLIDRIKRVASYKEKIEFFNLDAINFLKNYVTKLNLDFQKTLIYLDPPYFEKGPDLYRTFFCEQDHIRLKKYLKCELKHKWILSYDDVPFIKKLYEGRNRNDVRMNHFAYKAKVGKELIISSDNCILPDEKKEQ